MRPYMTKMKGSAAEATRVNSHPLTKDTTYSPIVNASDWNSIAKCCEIATWTVFDEVVIRVDTLPGDIVSMVATGWAKRARRYARRSAADMRRPLMRMQSLDGSVLFFQ